MNSIFGKNRPDCELVPPVMLTTGARGTPFFLKSVCVRWLASIFSPLFRVVLFRNLVSNRSLIVKERI